MKKWFNQLSTREQWMVSGAAIVVTIFLFYVVLWLPMNNAVNRLSGHAQYNDSLIAWMQRASATIQSAPQPVKRERLSLEAIQLALQHHGIDNKAVSFTQDNAKQFTLTVKRASFDKLIAAIVELHNTSQFSMQALNLRQVDDGLVSGAISLID
ncbi:MAG: hypothetical protein CMF39_03830 [Legionellaceae bacterium]|nr:hypothetical protein [Legionellaceae bacterium]|tara:strand:- start:514 stop:975 length:462 start_codon:yes stop_codon:yes gene_type:complete